MFWIKAVLIAVAGLTTIWAILFALGNWRWQGRTALLLSDLDAARVPIAQGRYDPALIADRHGTGPACPGA
jgi:hypothetical protein